MPIFPLAFALPTIVSGVPTLAGGLGGAAGLASLGLMSSGAKVSFPVLVGLKQTTQLCSAGILLGAGAVTAFNMKAPKLAKLVAVVAATAAAGVAAGPIAAAVATGTASTGASLSALKGAALWNAALAKLGGGTLASGGGGVAAGKAVVSAGGSAAGYSAATIKEIFSK